MFPKDKQWIEEKRARIIEAYHSFYTGNYEHLGLAEQLQEELNDVCGTSEDLIFELARAYRSNELWRKYRDLYGK